MIFTHVKIGFNNMIKSKWIKEIINYINMFNPFNHYRAQQYESNSAKIFIEEHFEGLYSRINAFKMNNIKDPGINELDVNGFYEGNENIWHKFATFIEGKTVLEIGPGPFGAIVGWWWVKNRIVIDPLIEDYKNTSLSIFHKTVYTDDIIQYSQPAEEKIPELINKIDGAIICRNALDHCENPMAILKNIADYSKSGCYLLLWTDLWHLHTLDEGHKNITKDKTGFEKQIRDYGFEILYSFDKVRKDASTIEYGCRARKQ